MFAAEPSFRALLAMKILFRSEKLPPGRWEAHTRFVMAPRAVTPPMGSVPFTEV